MFQLKNSNESAVYLLCFGFLPVYVHGLFCEYHEWHTPGTHNAVSRPTQPRSHGVVFGGVVNHSNLNFLKEPQFGRNHL